jgi:hypothetical protein
MPMRYPVILPPGKANALTWLAAEHGIECGIHDGEPWADSPDAQALIDGYNPLPETKERLKEALDKERQARVDRLADDRKKFLSLAEFDELLFLVEQLGELTVAQSQTRTALLGAWNTVGLLEAASAAITADIDALPDMAAAAAFDVAADPRWPA